MTSDKPAWQSGAEKYIDALSSSDPAPGGGSAAGIAGAIGASLASMAVSTTLKLKKTPPENKPFLTSLLSDLTLVISKLKSLSLEDAEAYQNYIDTKKASPDDKAAADKALSAAAMVPVNTAGAVMSVLALLNGEAMAKISPIIISDAKCARHILASALMCCRENIDINLAFIKDETTLHLLHDAADKINACLGEI
ncbi:Formiminotetrahydrofolate cyclodeaminase [Parelusimicrobium proximum]|uniref:cyclodeaminase/cyclohydrolase family protein n=1 Tax=Parelusimicrobium proximum TaxID=3228953 RepID=UPI003D174F72